MRFCEEGTEPWDFIVARSFLATTRAVKRRKKAVIFQQILLKPPKEEVS